MLEELGAPELRLYVVWIHILPGDDAAAAARAGAGLTDPRVAQFWDPDAALGRELGARLGLPPRRAGAGASSPDGLAWDVYLAFPRAARWEAPPAYWMHQLDGVPVALAPRLDAATFRAHVAPLLR